MVRAKKLPYIGALDGLRAVAVIAVLLYHSGLGWFPGGYLGVEVFFVLSGYLITSLLLIEWRQTGSIDLRAFWLRRARRLLPELFVVIVVTLAYALVFLPDEVAALRADALGAMVYITNWRLIFTHQSYFQSLGRPSLLQHLWSLAVEEQFYLVWPPVFALVVRIGRPRAMFIVAVAGAIASALLMASLYTPMADSSREYYGTDTRAAGVLIGASLAFVWAPWQSEARASLVRTRAIEGGGLVALLVLMFAFVKFDELNPWLYRGGFAAVSMTTALLIAASVQPQSFALARLLGNTPMRWIGTRSYGIYLWHWPVFMITRPGTDISLNTGVDLALRTTITFVLAELSYRFVAQRVRNGRLLRGLRELYHASGMAAWNVRVAGAGASMAAVAFIVLLADARVPATPDYLQVPEFHGVVSAAPSASATEWPSFLPTPPTDFAGAGASPVDPTAGATSAAPPESATAPAQSSGPPAPPNGVHTGGTADILAVGDSVMVGAAPYMGVMGAVEIDAVEGRQASSVVSLLRARKTAGTLPRVVIVHTGDNGTFQRSQFDAIMQALSGVQQVIFVNIRVDRSWESGDNAVISAGVAAYPNATLVDWHGATASHPELFWDDGIHVKPAGASLYANLIASAVQPAPPPPPTPTPIPPTATPTPTPVPPTVTPTPTATTVKSATPTSTPDPVTPTATSPASVTASPTTAASATASSTVSPSAEPTAAASPSPAGTSTATAAATAEATPAAASTTPTQTPTP